MAEVAVSQIAPIRAKLGRDDLIQGVGLALLAIFLVVVIWCSF